MKHSKIFWLVGIFLIIGIPIGFLSTRGTSKLEPECGSKLECDPKFVVVLHGLARSSASMNKISQALQDSGYTVCNVRYPSRKYTIEKLAVNFVYPEIKQCLGDIEQPLFVTHSMGGIIVRQLARSTPLKINRVVMLGAPNQGSELVDKLKVVPFFESINGRAGLSLGTESDSVPNTLGAVTFETGIIAGNKSFNPIYSALIPGEDDGKVAVKSTQVEGMSDFIVVPHSHSFMMNADTVIEQTIAFLEHGRFSLDR